jgi:hypothetical protein
MHSMSRLGSLVVAAVLVSGCAVQQPTAITGPEPGHAPVSRVPVAPPLAAAPAAPNVPAQPAPLPFPVSASTLYVCLKGSGDQAKQTAIEFAPNVAAVCKRHPEMGPCQYERDLCRKGGGRVFAANGAEITRQVEDEYDRRVMRVRFRAN